MISISSTVTSKGQVVIPKKIRDVFNIRPNSKIQFIINNKQIVVKPAATVDEMHGFIKTNKKLSKKDQQAIIKKAILKKHNI